MNYKRHYDLLIEKAKEKVRPRKEYTEKHHILPKCLGGSNDTSNLIRLSAREHFIAHWLLHRIYPNENKLSFAFKMMKSMKTKHQFRYTPSSRAIAEALEASGAATSTPMKGVPKSVDHVVKVAHSNTGKKRTIETRELQRSLKLGKPNGKSKGVYQFSLDGKLIAWHRTTVEAMRATGVLSSGIQFACQQKCRQAGGFCWEYGKPSDLGKCEKLVEVKVKIQEASEQDLDSILKILNSNN